MEKTKREIERRGVRSLREKERKGERKGREEERREISRKEKKKVVKRIAKNEKAVMILVACHNRYDSCCLLL